MRQIFLFLLLAFFFRAAFCAPVKLTLKDCIDVAIAQNPDLRAAFSSVKVSREKVSESRAPLQPNLGLSYNWTRKLSPLGPPIVSSLGTIQSQPLLLNTYTDAVSLTQLIYDGERTASLVKQAEALSLAQRSEYQRLVQSLSFQTTQAVYNLLADVELVKVAREDLDNANAHLELVKASYRAGTASRADVVFAEVPAATAKLTLTKSNETEKDAEAQLNRLLYFNLDTPVRIQESLEEKVYSVSLEGAYQRALAEREEIHQADAVLESAKAQVSAARGAYSPVVSLFGGFGYTDYGGKVLPGKQGYDYGLQGTFSLFDGNLLSSQLAEAKDELEKDQNLLESTKQNVLLDVKRSYLSFQSSEESVQEAKAELTKAEENLRMAEVQYKAGVVPILNLLDAEVERTAAATHLVQALSDNNISIAQLKYAMGEQVP